MSEELQKEIFSKNLRDLLYKCGKRQIDVANAIGVSQQTFNTWIQGIAIPRMSKVQALAEYFGVSKSALIDGKYENEYYVNPESAKIAQEIFENKELRLLFDAAKDVDPESLKAVHTLLLSLKRKEMGDN